MVDEDHLAAVDVQQVALRDHADIAVVAVKHGKIADAQLRHGRLDVRNGVIQSEGDDIALAHQMADGNALVDQLGGGVGVERRGDDSTARFLGDPHDRLGDLRAQTDDQTARAHLDRAKLGIAAVDEDDHIVFVDNFLHQIGICRGDNDLAHGEFSVGIAHNDLTLQGIRDIGIGRFCFRNSGGVTILHVKARLIAQREHAFDLAALSQNRHGLDVLVTHILPCALERQGRIDGLDPAEGHVGNRRFDGFEQLRRRHTELVEHIFGLAVDLARTAGHMLLTREPMLEISVADRGADRVGIGIFMTDDNRRFHGSSSFMFNVMIGYW